MENPDNVQYHIKVKRGDVGRYVLLPGDPGRCESIAAYLDDARFLSLIGNIKSIPEN